MSYDGNKRAILPYFWELGLFTKFIVDDVSQHNQVPIFKVENVSQHTG